MEGCVTAHNVCKIIIVPAKCTIYAKCSTFIGVIKQCADAAVSSDLQLLIVCTFILLLLASVNRQSAMQMACC